MRILRYCTWFLACLLWGPSLHAQWVDQSRVVQLSGLVLDGTRDKLVPIPYTAIGVKDSYRGTYADSKGFFSLPVEKGETLIFSTLGYKTVEFVVPDTLSADKYTIYQLMTADTFNLPTTVVYPWPDKRFFKQEFLAMDVSSELQQKAAENVAKESLERLRYEIPATGAEYANLYMRQESSKLYYKGQVPPMNIFNPFAWAQFVKAWKEGKFKKQKKKYDDE